MVTRNPYAITPSAQEFEAFCHDVEQAFSDRALRYFRKQSQSQPHLQLTQEDQMQIQLLRGRMYQLSQSLNGLSKDEYEPRLTKMATEFCNNTDVLSSTYGAAFAELIIEHQRTSGRSPEPVPAYTLLLKALLMDAVEIASNSHLLIARYIATASNNDVVSLANAIFRGEGTVFNSKRVKAYRRQIVYIFVRRLDKNDPAHEEMLAEVLEDIANHEPEFFHQLFRPIPTSSVDVRSIEHVKRVLMNGQHEVDESGGTPLYMMQLLMDKAASLPQWRLVRDRAANDSTSIVEGVEASEGGYQNRTSKRACSCNSFETFITSNMTQARLFIDKLFQQGVTYLCMNNFAMFVEKILDLYPEYLTYIASNLVTDDIPTQDGSWSFEYVCNHKTGNFTVQKVLEMLWMSMHECDEHRQLYDQYVHHIGTFHGSKCRKFVWCKIDQLENGIVSRSQR